MKVIVDLKKESVRVRAEHRGETESITAMASGFAISGYSMEMWSGDSKDPAWVEFPITAVVNGAG